MTNGSDDDYPISRRQLANAVGILGTATVTGGGILFAEEIREYLAGREEQNGDRGTPEPTDTPKATAEPTETPTDEPGVFSPTANVIKLSDPHMRNLAVYIRDDYEGEDLDNQAVYKQVLNWANDNGADEDQINRFEWNRGDPVLFTDYEDDGEFFSMKENIDPVIYKAADQFYFGEKQ